MSKATGSKAGKSKSQKKPAPGKKPGTAKLGKITGAAKKANKAEASRAGPAKAAKPVAKKPVAKPAAKTAKKSPAKAPAQTITSVKTAASKKSEGIAKKMAPRLKTADIVLPPDYRPSDNEPFMSDLHRAYFRKRLLDWKDDILRQTRETLAILHEDSSQHADLADRATSETDRATELRTRDRQRKLIAKIDAALARIEDGSYGYCEETGEPIGLKRLDARPIATLSVEAQERHERREKVYREE